MTRPRAAQKKKTARSPAVTASEQTIDRRQSGERGEIQSLATRPICASIMGSTGVYTQSGIPRVGTPTGRVARSMSSTVASAKTITVAAGHALRRCRRISGQWALAPTDIISQTDSKRISASRSPEPRDTPARTPRNRHAVRRDNAAILSAGLTRRRLASSYDSPHSGHTLPGRPLVEYPHVGQAVSPFFPLPTRQQAGGTADRVNEGDALRAETIAPVPS